MLITTPQGNSLCQTIINDLLNWPAHMAALQSGRGERNKAGIVESSMAKWLNSCAPTPNLLVLMEHQNIDYALVQSTSVGASQLVTENVIEFKFNYAGQTTEIDKRLKGWCDHKKGNWKPSAFQQASQYAQYIIRGKTWIKRASPIPAAFVLYLVADPIVNSIPTHPNRDAGWAYWGSHPTAGTQLAMASDNIESFVNSHLQLQLIGSANATSSAKNAAVYCCLVKVDAPYVDAGHPSCVSASAAAKSAAVAGSANNL